MSKKEETKVIKFPTANGSKVEDVKQQEHDRQEIISKFNKIMCEKGSVIRLTEESNLVVDSTTTCAKAMVMTDIDDGVDANTILLNIIVPTALVTYSWYMYPSTYTKESGVKLLECIDEMVKFPLIQGEKVGSVITIDEAFNQYMPFSEDMFISLLREEQSGEPIGSTLNSVSEELQKYYYVMMVQCQLLVKQMELQNVPTSTIVTYDGERYTYHMLNSDRLDIQFGVELREFGDSVIMIPLLMSIDFITDAELALLKLKSLSYLKSIDGTEERALDILSNAPQFEVILNH